MTNECVWETMKEEVCGKLQGEDEREIVRNWIMCPVLDLSDGGCSEK